MMKLYWSPRSRSFSALWLMEETEQPYERVLTDISTGAQKTSEFLAINPMAPMSRSVILRRGLRRHWATPCARNIFTGCSSHLAASSLQWFRLRPRSR